MCWHLGNVALEARVVERKNFPKQFTYVWPSKSKIPKGGCVPKTCVRRSKHGIASKVISLGGIAPQNPLSLHTMGGHFYYIWWGVTYMFKHASRIPCQILPVRFGVWSKHSCRPCRRVSKNDLAPALALPCALQDFFLTEKDLYLIRGCPRYVAQGGIWWFHCSTPFCTFNSSWQPQQGTC